MKSTLKIFLLSALSLAICQQAFAATPHTVDTLTCTDAQGHIFQHPVYAFSLDSNATKPDYFLAYFSEAPFEDLMILSQGGTFTSCTFGKLPGTVIEYVTVLDVDTVAVGANVGTLSLQEDTSSQTYVEAVFSYDRITLGKSATTTSHELSSKEDQTKALAAFKAKGISILK